MHLVVIVFALFVYVVSDNNGEKTDASDRYWKLKKDGSKGIHPMSEQGSEYWEKMEYFESIYADVGAFNSALVGPMVFHENYMFSQRGTFRDEENKATNNALYSVCDNPKSAIESTADSTQRFYPNFVVNCETGQVDIGYTAACGRGCCFRKDGSGFIAGGQISWNRNTEGSEKWSVTLGNNVSLKWDQIEDREGVTDAINKAQETADTASSRMDDWMGDNVISKFELRGIQDEKVYIVADRNEIDSQLTRYSLNNANVTNYKNSYDTYLSDLTTIIEGFSQSVEFVSPPDGFSNHQDRKSTRLNSSH